MAAEIAKIAAHFRWRGPIGVGFPGVIFTPRILTAANLHKGFAGLDAVRLFSGASGCPVTLVNDAEAAATAEMRFGAGRGFAGKTLLLTLGTGVGSALAYKGVVVPCEFGHLPIKGKSAEKRVAASVRKARGLTWEEWGLRLHDYVATLEMMLWPELIIIGGGVSAKHGKFFRYVKPRARMVPAGFLNEAGIVGAAVAAATEAGTGRRSRKM
jgi:polyphosphate glucokinase